MTTARILDNTYIVYCLALSRVFTSLLVRLAPPCLSDYGTCDGVAHCVLAHAGQQPREARTGAAGGRARFPA